MSRFNLKPGPSGPHPGRAGLHPPQGRHPHRHHRRGRLLRRRRRGNRLEPATGRMQQTPTAPYPVGALCCNSGRGVAIGTATEIVALQHQHSGVHQGRTGARLSVKVITVRYHPLRREFSLTEGPAPRTHSCLGSLAAAFSAGSRQGHVVNGGDISQSRRGGSRYSPTVPSIASRRKSAWPAWRAVSSMRCSSTHRSEKRRPSRNALTDS